MAFSFDTTQPTVRNVPYIPRRSKKHSNRRRVRRKDSIPEPGMAQIAFSQVNLGKRVLAMNTLNQRHSKGYFISLIQEPHTLGGKGKGKLSGLDNQHSIHKSNEQDCRSAIYAHKDIPLWLNNDLSDKDTTSCLWVTKDNDLGRVMLISCYWDRFLLSPPPKLVESIEFAKRNNFRILVGMDSNAHSVLSGSDSTDARGVLLENLVLKYQLDIANRGNQATFEITCGQILYRCHFVFSGNI